jgi:hypothetical protein
MIAEARRGDRIDEVPALNGDDLGLRLAAYDSLYVNPDPSSRSRW